MALVGGHINRYHAKGKRPNILAHIKVAQQEAEDEAKFPLGVVSIFVGGPKNREITLNEDERIELREFIEETGLQVIAHSSYSANSWSKGDPDAAHFIREELEVCQEAGIRGLVVHLPKAPISQTMKYIARLFNPNAPDVRVYLETPAVNPKETYYETPAKLAALFTAIREQFDPDLEYFGLCVDSAHIWTCGVDVSDYASADAWLSELEKFADTIPHEVVMIHLNDSARALGVGPDTHAPLLRGKIWESYRDSPEKSGLAAFTDYAQRHDAPIILERKPKEMLTSDYLILRKLIPPAE